MIEKMRRIPVILMVFFQLLLIAPVQSPVAAKPEPEDSPAKKLIALGILNDAKQSDKSVTKEEYAGLVVDLLGMREVTGKYVELTPFVDVEINSDYLGDIYLLYRLGCISGDEKSRFYPKKNITYTEAVTVLVNALGYKERAVNKGGYPTGYLIVANDIGITGNTAKQANAELTHEILYELFDRCLDVKPLKYLTDSGKDGLTLLELYHGIEKKKGIVTGNVYTALGEEGRSMKSGQIQLDGVNYNVSGEAFAELLGMQAEYYKGIRDYNEYTIYYVSGYKNDITVISARDVFFSDSDSIEYYDNGKKETLRLSNNCDVIYNDKVKTGYGTIDKLLPKNGIFKGIDRDNDGLTDVLVITKFDSLMADSIDTTNKTVYDEYTSRFVALDETQCDVIIYQENGITMKFSDLKTGMLLSIAESLPSTGKALKKVYISSAKTEGRIDEVTDEDGILYTIGGKQYYLSENYKEAMEQNSELLLSVGDEGIFYLDVLGDIAGATLKNDDTMLYAVVAQTNHKTGVSDKLELKLFTQKSRFVYTSLEKGYRIDGTYRTKLSNEDISTMSNMVGTAVRFRLKEDLSIAEIDTCNDGPAKGVTKLREGDSVRYRYNIINGQIALNNDTVIFSCPKNTDDETDYGVISTAAFEQGSAQSVKFSAYSLGDLDINLATAVVVHDFSMGGIQATTPSFMVTKVSRALDDNGEETELIRCVRNNGFDEFYTVKIGFSEENNLTAGDVFRAVRNNQGKVSKIEKVFDYEGGNGTVDNHGKSTNSSVFDAQYVVLYAEVQNVKDGFLKYQTDSGAEGIIALGGAKVDCFTKDSGKFSTMTSASLAEGDKIVVRTHLGIAQEIFLYR